MNMISDSNDPRPTNILADVGGGDNVLSLDLHTDAEKLQRQANNNAAVLELYRRIFDATTVSGLEAALRDTASLFSLSALALFAGTNGRQQFHCILHAGDGATAEPAIEPLSASFNKDGHYVNGETLYRPLPASGEHLACVALPQTHWHALDDLDRDRLLRVCGRLAGKYRCLQRLTVRQSQHQLLQQTLLQTDEYLSRWDPDNGWQHFNPPVSQRLGHESQELCDSLVGDSAVLRRQYRQQLQDQWRQCQRTGQDTVIQFQVTDCYGKNHQFHCTLRVTRTNADGGAEEVLALTLDITSTTVADDTVLEQTRIEQWMLEKTSLLFTHPTKKTVRRVLKELGELLQVSRCFVRTYEKSQRVLYAEWVNQGIEPMAVLQPTLNIDMERQKYDQFLLDGNPIVIDDLSKHDYGPGFVQYAMKVGVKAHIVMPVTYHDQVTAHLVVHSGEVRHWREVEERVVRVIGDAIGMVIANDRLIKQVNFSEQRFRFAMDAAAYALWEIDLTNDTILIGHTFDNMLGLKTNRSSHGFRSISFHSVHPDERPIAEENYQKLKNGIINEYTHEARHIRKDGSYIWLLTHAKVVSRDKNGNPLRAMGTHADISEIKNSQIDLQLTLQETDAIARAKSEFLARMSHEIRTPMNAILGMSNLLLQTPLSAELRHYIHDIESAAAGLLHTIDDILDFSKIEAGKLNIEYHRFDLHELVIGTVENFSQQCAQKGIALDVDIATDTPQVVSSDSVRLKQILTNMLSNAIKFTAAGAIRVTVKPLKHQASRVWIEFTVADTGIGMDQTTVQQLFDPFTQADGSATRRFGGTGLGLAICHRLINLLGGDIDVRSVPGESSEFRFTVACKNTCLPVSVPEENRFPVTSPTMDDDKLLASMQILLAEDNPVNQKIARSIMEKKHIKVIIANNGNEALLIAKGCPPGELDMILMDIEMPQLNGIEATAAIRKIDRYASIPIIAMTAHSGEDRTYLEQGLSDCITKPITPDALYQKLLQNYRRLIS